MPFFAHILMSPAPNKIIRFIIYSRIHIINHIFEKRVTVHDNIQNLEEFG